MGKANRVYWGEDAKILDKLFDMEKMMNKEDIQAAIKRLSAAHSWRDGMTVQEQDIILEALQLALEMVEPVEGDMPEEIGVDNDFPTTGDNRFSLKIKEHRTRYTRARKT